MSQLLYIYTNGPGSEGERTLSFFFFFLPSSCGVTIYYYETMQKLSMSAYNDQDFYKNHTLYFL